MPRIVIDPSGNIVFSIKVSDEDGHPISLTLASVTKIAGVVQSTQPTWFVGSTTASGQVLTDGSYELTITFTWAAANVPREIIEVTVEATDNLSPEPATTTFTVDIADVPTIVLPEDVANLVGQFSADSLIGFSDLDVVGEWENDADSGGNLIQATTSSKPQYIANDADLGFPVVSFDSEDDFITQTFSYGSDATFFILCKITEPLEVNDRRYLLNYDASDPRDTQFNYFRDSGGVQMNMIHASGSGTASGNVSLPYHFDPTAGYHLHTLVFKDESSGESQLFMDGVLKMYASLRGDTSAFINFGENLGGRIAEIICYNRALSGSERQDIERWIAQKYDLPIGPNPDFNPATLPNLHAWYNASDIVPETHLVDTDRVATWPDAGPNGYDLTATLTAQRPTYGTQGGGGLPTVIFDGVGNYMRASFGTEIGTDSTIILCGKALAPTNRAYFIDGIESSKRHAIYVEPGQISGVYQGTFEIEGNALGFGDYTSVSGIFSTVDDRLYLNQRNIVIGNAGSASLNGITIGSRYDNLSINMLKGEICEILVFNTAISHGLRQQLEAYLAWKYGTDFGVFSPNNP